MRDRQDPLKRHSREAVGAFVIIALALFAFAATQAGRIQEMLDPGVSVRILMPEEGLYGLSAGANVEILGTVAGEVREIVIKSDQNMHALVYLRREMMSFVRRDSNAFIKRRFGVAGDAYLEITRGTGPALDPSYVVMSASGERIPTQTIEQLITEVRQRALPILDQAEAAIGALSRVAIMMDEGRDDIRGFLSTLNTVGQKIERGEGTVGRLVNDTTLIRNLEEVLAQTNEAVKRLTPILDQMQAVARNAAVMSEQLGQQSSAIPEVTRRAASALTSLEAVMEDVRATTPQLPRLARNVADTTERLPELIAQTEQSLAELEALIRQLRGNWLLGGGGGTPAAEAATRISPLKVTP